MIAKIFRSFRDFQDDLGRIDAAFAYITLCIRHFESCGTLSGDRSKYMLEQATNHSIRVNLPDDKFPQKHVFFSSAVAIHSQWDRFLYELIEELPTFNYRKIDNSKRGDKESRLSFFLSMIKNDLSTKLIDLPELLLNICEYLRLIRNYYAHRLKSPQNECVKLFKKIQENNSNFPPKFGKLSLSSECCEIGFDDVLIFTIATKMLAEDICNSLAPEVDRLLEHSDTKAFITNEKQKVSKESIELFMFDRFGLDRQNAERLSTIFINGALV